MCRHAFFPRCVTTVTVLAFLVPVLTACSQRTSSFLTFTSSPGPAAGSGTGSATGTGESGQEEETAGQTGDRPASLTEAGWAGSPVRCEYGDSWIYAAQGTPGQVVICVGDDFLYAVDTGQGYSGESAYSGISAVCPLAGAGRERYVWYHADTGWTEYDGTTRYVMDIFSGRGEVDLTDKDNLARDTYDGAWENTAVDIPTLQWCASTGESPTDRLLSRS